MALISSPDGPIRAVYCEVCSIGEAMKDQEISLQNPVLTAHKKFALFFLRIKKMSL